MPTLPQYHWVVPLFAAVGNLCLCVFVYSHDRQKPVHQVFALMSLTVALWNLDIFSLDYASTPAQALYWSRLFRVGMVLMPPTFLHLALILTDNKMKWMRAILVVGYMTAVFLIVANGFDLLVSHLERLTWGYYPRPRRLYTVHTASFAINAALAGAVLMHAYNHSPSARVRLQVRFWLLGLVVALPLGATNHFAVYRIPIYPLGSLGSVAFSGVVAYAIVQHRLMDIDVVVAKGAAYALVTLSLIVPAFAFAEWMQRQVFGRIDPNFSAVLLLSYVVVAVLFPLVRRRTETRIGHSLFPGKHEYRAALAGFTGSIIRILDRDRLIRELGDTLSRVLELDRIAVFVQDSEQAYRLSYSLGSAPTTDVFARDASLVRSLAERGEAVLREELATGSVEHSTVRDLCRANGWEVCLPLAVSGRLIGFVNLGRKRTLDVFSVGDLELLNTLAAEAAVALENARLNEELRRSHDIIQRADRLSALGTLAAGIAHEVRNPLVSIQTFFQLAPDRLHDEEFLTTFLGMTANEVKRITDLIAELLSFARSPARMLRDVDLNDAVERVATLLEPEAKKHRIEFTRTLSPSVPFVFGDPDQVKQVLINLILNALQATAPGGLVSVTSRAIEHRGVPFGQIEIRDTGTGIPPDKQNDIFNPFFTTKDKGTGLGLAIAHQIVVEHGGSLSLESIEGSGSSFFVDLPAMRTAGTVQQTAEPDAAASGAAPDSHPRPRKLAS